MALFRPKQSRKAQPVINSNDKGNTETESEMYSNESSNASRPSNGCAMRNRTRHLLCQLLVSLSSISRILVTHRQPYPHHLLAHRCRLAGSLSSAHRHLLHLSHSRHPPLRLAPSHSPPHRLHRLHHDPYSPPHKPTPHRSPSLLLRLLESFLLYHPESFRSPRRPRPSRCHPTEHLATHPTTLDRVQTGEF